MNSNEYIINRPHEQIGYTILLKLHDQLFFQVNQFFINRIGHKFGSLLFESINNALKQELNIKLRNQIYDDL
jgi:hypothetical protein